MRLVVGGQHRNGVAAVRRRQRRATGGLSAGRTGKREEGRLVSADVGGRSDTGGDTPSVRCCCVFVQEKRDTARSRSEREELRRMNASACLLVNWEGGPSAREENEGIWYGDVVWDMVSRSKKREKKYR